MLMLVNWWLMVTAHITVLVEQLEITVVVLRCHLPHIIEVLRIIAYLLGYYIVLLMVLQNNLLLVVEVLRMLGFALALVYSCFRTQNVLGKRPS